jgi:hypothetical protein
MKFKVGDKVKIRNGIEEVHPKLYGQTGVVVEIDGDWSHPYEVKYDDEGLREEVEGGWIQDLFCDTDLELAEQPKAKELPATFKLMYIRDLKGIGDTSDNAIRCASIIDLEKGVNRLNLHTSDIDDIVDYIKMNKPNRVIFDIHDRTFRALFISYVNGVETGFTMKENGEIEYV